MHKAYYNEIDPKAAAWLRELIKQGLIAPGDVDERSIEDVLPTELAGYTQCHFFAGIGVWSHALRQAGWPDDRPVWTGSCPCQPFSAAGKRGGVDDERHLWPAWFWLISQCRPDVVYGEQVGGKGGREWFRLVSSDLAGIGYRGNVKELPACGFGAPHIRQRLYFVAESLSGKEYASAEGRLHAESGSSGTVDELADAISLAVRSERPRSHVQETAKMEGDKREQVWADSSERGTVGELADATIKRHDGRRSGEASGGTGESERSRNAGILEHAASDGRDARRAESDRRGIASGCGTDILGYAESGIGRVSIREEQIDSVEPGGAGPTNGFWRDAQWIYCRDDKYRAVEPGTFPLAHGVPGRVGRLRAYGNAIVPQVAAEFIKAAM